MISAWNENDSDMVGGEGDGDGQRRKVRNERRGTSWSLAPQTLHLHHQATPSTFSHRPCRRPGSHPTAACSKTCSPIPALLASSAPACACASSGVLTTRASAPVHRAQAQLVRSPVERSKVQEHVRRSSVVLRSLSWPTRLAPTECSRRGAVSPPLDHPEHRDAHTQNSHPPTYYLPSEDVKTSLLSKSARSSFCEVGTALHRRHSRHTHARARAHTHTH